jgi:hypothetical protein
LVISNKKTNFAAENLKRSVMKSNLLASSSDEERTKAFRRMVNMREEWLAYVKQREAKLGIQ